MQKWTSSGLYTTAIKVFMNEHHQVGKTEGTLKILARLKDQKRKGIEYSQAHKAQASASIIMKTFGFSSNL